MVDHLRCLRTKVNTTRRLRTDRDAGAVFSHMSVRPTASQQPEVCVFEQ